MDAAKSIPDIGEVEPPVAQLQTICFEALRNGNATESTNLFDACCRDGIFYLDMLGTAPGVLQAVEDIYMLEENIFSQSEESLMQYDIDKLSPRKLNGYKPIGRNHGELVGNRDGFQSYALPKDGIMRLGDEANFERPPVVDSHMPSLHIFTLAISAAVSVILNALSASLELQPKESIRTVHRTELPSPDLIRLLKYHAQPISERGSSHVPHTDLGSMSFLFTKQYGLQTLSSKDQQWAYVQPRAGHAIVNIGDCLSLLTNKVLHSCRHRVYALPGQAMKERYSFAYFLRPEDKTPIRALKSRLIPESKEPEKEVFTSGEWMKRKYAMLRKDTWNQHNNWILSGA